MASSGDPKAWLPKRVQRNEFVGGKSGWLSRCRVTSEACVIGCWRAACVLVQIDKTLCEVTTQSPCEKVARRDVCTWQRDEIEHWSLARELLRGDVGVRMHRNTTKKPPTGGERGLARATPRRCISPSITPNARRAGGEAGKHGRGSHVVAMSVVNEVEREWVFSPRAFGNLETGVGVYTPVVCSLVPTSRFVSLSPPKASHHTKIFADGFSTIFQTQFSKFMTFFCQKEKIWNLGV